MLGRAVVASRGQAGRTVAAVVLAALATALALRIVDLVSLPSIRGFDPYLRLYERETFVIEFFGRRWLPGFQSLIVAFYWLDWGLPAVRWASALLASAYIGLVFAMGWRRFGLFFGLVWTAWLHLDADLVHVSATPYQEPLFFAFVAAALLFFGRIREAPVPRDLLLVSVALAGASITRNEAVVFGFALAFALLLGRGPGQPAPARRQLVGPAALLAGIPLAVNAAVVLAMGADLGIPYGRYSRVGANFEHVLSYLAAPHVGWVAALGALGLALAAWKRRLFDRDVLAINAFGLGFFVLYLVWTPYMPTDSRRFHLSLTFWLSFDAALALSLGLEYLARWWGDRAKLDRVAALAAALGLTVFLVVDADRVVGEYRARRPSHIVARVVGESIDAAVGREALVVLPGSSLARYQKAATATLRIFGYMGGSPGRLLFADELAKLSSAELTALVQERDVRAVLLTAGDRAAPFRSALAARGDPVRRERVEGYSLLYR